MVFSAGPSISDKEIEYVNDAIRNAWYENAYMYISEFENKVAQYVGREYALALPSGTSAIHLSLLSCGVEKGDEVICPDFTWLGTSAPITYVGATPVLVDVDRNTWCVSPEEIEKHITKRTKAVYSVDLFGNMPDYDRIIEICDRHGLVLLEDSAQAIGSSYKGKMAGSFGEASIFSFHGTKLITTGEGGMLLTDNKELYDRAAKLANYGRQIDSKRMFWFDEIGYKYKYTSLQAAMGLAQIERIQELLDKRRKIFSWYEEELSNCSGIQINSPGDDVISNFWMTTVFFDEGCYSFEKEDVVKWLAEREIQCRPVVYQLSSMPAYSFIHQDWENPNSSFLSRMGINLPCPHRLTRNEAAQTCEAIYLFLENYQKEK